MKTLTLSLILFASVCAGQSKIDSIKLDSLHWTIHYALDDFKIYKINWHKVKTLADLKLILEAFDLRVTGNSQAYKKIKKYLIEAK